MEFGECTQANECNDPGNDTWARCIDGAYLQPAENQTVHCVMDLQTKTDIIRDSKITVIPLTDTAKNVVKKYDN